MVAGNARQRHVFFKRPAWVVLALVLLAIVAPSIGSPAAERPTPLPPLPTPQRIAFHVVAGQSNPPPQPVRIASPAEELLWTAEYDVTWLALDSIQGVTPAEIWLRVDATGFTPGHYETMLRIEPGTLLPVSLDVYTPSQGPAILAEPITLDFTARLGSPTPKPQTIMVRPLEAGGEQTWSAVTSAPWMTLSAYSGVAPAELLVSVNHELLTPGEHAGTVWVGAQAVTVRILVNELVVPEGDPLPEARLPNYEWIEPASQPGRHDTMLPTTPGELTIDPLELHFASAQGGVQPKGKALELASADGTAQPWAAVADVPWLVLSGNAGMTPQILSVELTANQLGPGEHVGTISVNGQAVTVRVRVLERKEPPPAFLERVGRHDEPVRTTQVGRTWLWGPQPLGTVSEPYAEAPGGQRIVQYYDKARMEITQPGADQASIWYVTNGRLAWELITGRMQIGDALYSPDSPSDIPVAGDADDLLGPTYASFTGLLTGTPGTVGAPLTQTITRDGRVGNSSALTAHGVTVGFVEPLTNHAVASVFWNYLQSRGPVWEGGTLVDAQLFEPWHFVTGLPIAEPYWARVKVGGKVQDVLIQCFERRCLTYTPGNAPEWRVEQGNVGLHYFRWRYE